MQNQAGGKDRAKEGETMPAGATEQGRSSDVEKAAKVIQEEGKSTEVVVPPAPNVPPLETNVPRVETP